MTTSSAGKVREWDDRRLQHDRTALVQAEMQRQHVGALVLSDGVLRRYVLNLDVPGAKLLVPVAGDPLVFVRPRDEGYVKAWHPQVRPPLGRIREDAPASTDAPGPAARGLVDCLAELGLKDEPVGIDTMAVPDLLDLVALGVRIVDAEQVIERAWTVKTADELAIYRRIARQYVTALSAFRDAARPGATEQDLAAVATVAWLQSGGEDIAQMNVCAGENMNPWRRWPTDHQLREGEFVGIDLHGRGPNGLRGDASTTFLVGDRPTGQQRDLHRRAYDYVQGVIPVLRAGRSIADAMASVPSVPAQFRAQLDNYNVAHGIGMGSSGYPHLDPRRAPIDDVLRPNQILAVECYLGEVGSPLAVKLEEQIIVCDGEPEVLGPIPVDDRLLT
ncbi:MAG: M24 family metallopeptidase [Chloroflexi bacterium]|nr:M24 family metallopeptidase [Chloroflexota bacterium]